MPTHPKGKQASSKVKRNSGPLKRSGKRAKTWDESVGPSISVIPGNQLPQLKTVLQRYHALRILQPSAKTSTLASHIADEVTSIWDRARIPISSHQVVINKIVSSVEWWNSSFKLKSESKRIELTKLFDIAPKLRGKVSEDRQLEHLRDCMRQESSVQRKRTEGDSCNWEVDFKFYIDQSKGDRVQTLGVADNKLRKVEHASGERAKKLAKYYDHQTNEASTSSTPADMNAAYGTNTSSSEPDDVDEEYQPPPQPPSPNITLKLPRRELLSGTAELATRCNISHRKSTAMTANIVKMGGGQLAKCSVSASTSQRQRYKRVTQAEHKIKADMKSNMPTNIILHWDGKVIKYANRKETDERLAIVMSSPALDHPQFLAAPHIPNGTGASMRDALVETLQVWEIPHNNIIGMSWDTTSSNTGRRQGSATLFEQVLGQGIMWLACRHHIGELHIKHADIEVRGAWAGPTDRLFERFRDQFGQLQFNDAQLNLWTWPDQTLPHTFLVDRALHVRSFLSEMLLGDIFGRDDYRELCELIIKYLGGQVIRPKRRPDARGDDFVMRAPGALHHARFMASCLYIMKLVMLAHVAHNLVTRDILVKLERMAVYICLFHGPWFLQARVPSIAPRLDLQIWEHMTMYRTIDGPVAEAVKLSLLRHLWYLTEELVVFAFFDDQVDHEVRDAMASKLNNIPRPNNFEPGKPKFPLIGNNPSMDKLIGPRSWLLFHLLGKAGDWLEMPSRQWDMGNEYHSMKETVSALEVVNDTAERGVKDIQDFANAARDGAYRGRIIIVANSNRVKIAEFTKNELEENL